MNVQTQEIEHLAEQLIGQQKRADGSSNAQHAKRVRTLLLAALTQAAETPREETRTALEHAALSHDFLEDTKISKEELARTIGTEALTYVQELTNTWGDTHADPYVAQMVAASEEARLIKYADLVDNIFHVSFSAPLLGKTWVHTYFIPIVDPMKEALAHTSFTRYPKTAAILRESASLARAHLGESISHL